jgi:hypothetical protein
MTEIIDKIKNGDWLDDKELDQAIEHYTKLCSLIGFHLDSYMLVYNDALGILRTLRTQRALRFNNKGLYNP